MLPGARMPTMTPSLRVKLHSENFYLPRIKQECRRKKRLICGMGARKEGRWFPINLHNGTQQGERGLTPIQKLRRRKPGHLYTKSAKVLHVFSNGNDLSAPEWPF